jgi:hypothetical protein
VTRKGLVSSNLTLGAFLPVNNDNYIGCLFFNGHRLKLFRYRLQPTELLEKRAETVHCLISFACSKTASLASISSILSFRVFIKNALMDIDSSLSFMSFISERLNH